MAFLGRKCQFKLNAERVKRSILTPREGDNSIVWKIFWSTEVSDRTIRVWNKLGHAKIGL